MPLYEYKCDQCGDVFERLQKFSDEPLTVHEKCGGPVHRLISRSALQFKGSGWYITDYAKSGANPAGSSKNEGDSKGSSSKGSSESKASDGNSSSKPSSSDSGSSSSTSTESSKPSASSSDK